jgi:hypothetical protein
MKHATLQLVTALLLAASAPQGTAQAAPDPADPMAGFYGNTVTIAVPSGYYYARRYIDPDGTWREPRGSAWIKGVWRIEGGQVCNWQTEPAVQNPRHYCYAIIARKAGDKWETTDPDSGNLVYQEIVPGRSEQP